MEMKWPKFLTKEQPVLYVKTMKDMDRYTDEDLWERVSKMIESDNWLYFEELVRRQRDVQMRDLVLSEQRGQWERIQGRIKTFDWLLQLRGYITKL